MATSNFITPAYVVSNYPMFNGNIDNDSIKAAIALAQSDYIYDALGTTLYQTIMDQIASSGAPTGNYKTLIDNYVVKALVCWVAYDMAVNLLGEFSNKGMQENSSDFSSAMSLEKVQAVRDSAQKKAGRFTQRLSDYLIHNEGLFPELYDNNGVDEKNPSGGGFISPIYFKRRPYPGKDGCCR